MLKHALLAAALALGAPPALAEPQLVLNEDATARAQEADAALNTQYQATSGALSKGPKAKLRDAQRAWIAFRDAECAFESSAVQGGSAQPMVRANCVERLTMERTAQLKAKSACQEGDLACPR